MLCRSDLRWTEEIRTCCREHSGNCFRVNRKILRVYRLLPCIIDNVLQKHLSYNKMGSFVIVCSIMENPVHSLLNYVHVLSVDRVFQVPWVLRVRQVPLEKR